MKNFSKNKVLIVDDEYINREILWNILNSTYDLDFAEDGDIALKKINETKYNLVLLDLLMPNIDGYEVLKRCKEQNVLTEIPFMVMTSEKSAEVECLKLGAVDFIAKPYDMPDVILARCERVIELFNKSQIIKSTERDTLTNLYTQNYFYEYITRFNEDNKNQIFDAVVVDIDNFHHINDLYGKEYGDNILKALGTSLEKLAGQSGICSRIEADMFFVYINHLDNYEDFLNLITEDLLSFEKINPSIVRIGIFENISKDTNIRSCFDKAKIASRQIRGNYINRIAYYSNELNDSLKYNQRLVNEFEEAINKHQFVIYYQPKMYIQDEIPKLKCAEALVRWVHPELGLISPGVFIPLFENNGLIAKLDKYIWNEVAKQIKSWKVEGKTVPISINLSRVDVLNPKLDEEIIEILNSNGILPEDISAEITESAYSNDSSKLIESINKIRAKGIKVEIDDFGAGYSSLSMLMDVKVDTLKIDMQFIKNIEDVYEKAKLVTKIIEVAKIFELSTVAEGVENEEQYKILKNIGCDIIQGYYFSKPLPAEEFKLFMNK